MDKRLSIIAAIIIIIALFAWAPWMSEASAKDSAKAAFENKWKGVADGCSFDHFSSVQKTTFGHEVGVVGFCGMLLPGQEPTPYEEKWFVSAFGVTKEITKQPVGYKPPTKGPAEVVPALQVSNFNFNETQTGPDKFTVKIDYTDIGGGAKKPIYVFEGPITKPDPCHTLTANYSVQSVDNANIVIIDITANPGPPGTACIQVIAATFYKGSFEFSGDLDGIIVNYQGTQIGREGFVQAYT